jgi:glutathione S-transferase
MTLTLTIGNYNYSSWSMRPWVALTAAGMAFETEKIVLDTDEFRAKVGALSPAGKVPVLQDGTLVVWDTLAIIEYAYETHPSIWPAARAQRARARSLCAQMHSGFTGLRNAMPMNIEASLPGVGHTADALKDAAALQALWEAELQAQGGPFLFGNWCAADAYFAPVVMRLASYAVPVSSAVQAYMAAVQAHPAVQEWVSRAKAERIYVALDEPYRTAAQAGY